MCFKPKRDPRIEEEQKQARAAAEAAKQKAIDEAVEARMKQLEAEREQQATAAATEKAQKEKNARQAEMSASVAPTPTPAPTPAPKPSKSLMAEPETVREKTDDTSIKVQGSEVGATGLKVDAAKPSAAMLRRRSKRAGRGRRSLLSSSAGGMGYFSRFL